MLAAGSLDHKYLKDACGRSAAYIIRLDFAPQTNVEEWRTATYFYPLFFSTLRFLGRPTILPMTDG